MRGSTFGRTTAAALVLTSTWVAAPALANPAAQSRAVIEDQLADFARDDILGAYEHASPGIKAVFPTAEIFGEMVARGYPMVLRNRSIDYLDVEVVGDALAEHRLRLVDPAGVAYIARYRLERGGDGVWRIAAVRIEREPEVGA